ncbi:adenylate/guanylate cyclase domain-containing protein [Roseivirga sp. E12]|uniref:adenylate/guanylate cyclase domain-containing protein n=1 Tax=Roseivirga sp. E12 TaxID=2819237 RepID=UPI001ABC18DB|nr:adenylate/guanylate cyclase domain-containing protein [Roseivirga sp. E12]MBO3697420.1 adenylate/guanylate cyclase domain-containing protein [Roseivirga sp. E12]
MRNFFTNNKESLNLIRDYIVGWLIALTFWVIVRNVGVIPDTPAQPTVWHNIRLVIVFGTLAGILFGIAQLKLERYLYRRVPLWRLGLYGLLTDAFIMTVIFALAYRFFKNIVGFDQEVSFLEFIQNPSAVLTFFYSILVSFVLAAIRQLNLLLGRGNLLRFIKGDFYEPRVENRVFMFVDLRDSTGIAEKLGHIRYSSFLQDCFYDLHVVQRYGAEVYQYVGDEVVLSWRIREKMDFRKCLDAFWAFEDQLISRSKFYFDKYGIQPKFKAGLHFGEVTTAEVGEIKREIAYHGDTMNIAARIQEKCNHFEKTLLISEYVHSALDSNGACDFELMGEELLRGKQQGVRIYAVNRK